MKKFSFSIGQKVLIANLTIIAVFTINAVVSLITLNSSKNVINQSSEVINPSVTAIDEFTLVVSRAKMYITNWIYLPADINEGDKESLRELHRTDFPALKERLSRLKRHWQRSEHVSEMDSIIIRFDGMLTLQEQLMERFSEPSDYNDASNRIFADAMMQEHIIPTSTILIERLEALSRAKKNDKQKADVEVALSLQSLTFVIVGLGLLAVIVGLVASYISFRSIAEPIKYVSNVARTLAEGIIPRDYEREYGHDEVGEMARAMRRLVNNLKSTSAFAEGIGNGQYLSDYKPLSSRDVLGNALINMRNNLQKVVEDDKKRNWATEGLARFGDILRSNYTSISSFAEEVIFNLVKYVNANQGGIFVIDETSNPDDPYMVMQGCYAWDRKRYLEKVIYRGEGLAGQAWQEESTIYVTEVPQEYIQITSGLGQANPRSILIAPLKVNDDVFGIIEMAFFHTLQSYEIEFVEKIAESFASTLSTVRINEKTQSLLEESQLLTEQMRAQEEEMRQNVEELQATQEEMKRFQREVEEKEAVLNATNLILETNSHFIIQKVNDHIYDYLQYEPGDLIGSHISVLFDTELDFSQVMKSLENGQITSRIANLSSQKNARLLAKISAAPIEDRLRKVTTYIFIIDNISEIKRHLEKVLSM